MILVIDNYDSFTYNLVQYLGELGQTLSIAKDIEVYRNDQITLEEIKAKTQTPSSSLPALALQTTPVFR